MLLIINYLIEIIYGWTKGINCRNSVGVQVDLCISCLLIIIWV